MEKQTLSACFADMANYSRLVDTVGSEEGMEILQDAFQVVGDIIVESDGKIRKYIGDAILFTFADPHRAIAAAREISATYHRTVGTLNLRYCIGVATGEVLVGQIGHPSRLVVDVMGATVNHAARLAKEAFRTESGVVLCEETKKYL